MEEIVTAIVAKMDASSLLLAIVLYGVWRLGTQALITFKAHAEQVAASLKSMSEDTHALRQDLAEIVKTVAVHEVRLDSLERNRD